MTRERRIGLIILGGFLLVGLVAAAVTLARESKTLTYTLVFKDAQGIERGARVQLNGVNIGVVKWVQLYPQPPRVEIHVKIPPEHADKVRSDATARIADVAFPNVSGQKIIEILNPSQPLKVPPMARGAVVYGLNGFLEYEAWKLKSALAARHDALTDRLGQLGDNLRNLNDEIKQMAASPQVRKALDDLRDFLKQMKEKGRQAATDLQARWPQIREEMEPVLKELSEFGREYIVKQIRQIMMQIETTLREWSRNAPARPSPPAESPIAANPSQT